MLTTIGKCLAVVAAVLALAFAGFALIATAGGPNWQAKAAALDEYQFAQTEGETPQWTATFRLSGAGEGGGESVGSQAEMLPPKIVDALNHKQQRQRDEIARLDAAIQGNPQEGLAPLEQRIQEARQTIEVDLKALGEYEQQLAAELQRVLAAAEELSQQVVQKTQEGFAKGREASERREEIYRLRNQLEEIHADIYRTQVQQEKLRDLLNRTYGAIGRLERRKQQLVSPGANGQYEEPTAAAAPAGAPVGAD
jgi:hypothetical protein